MPRNVLPLHLKQTFPPIICIFNEGEGDGTEFRLTFTISSTLQNTLINKESLVKFWLNYVELVEGLTSNCNLKERLVSLYGCSRSELGNQSCKTTPPIHHKKTIDTMFWREESNSTTCTLPQLHFLLKISHLHSAIRLLAARVLYGLSIIRPGQSRLYTVGRK